MEETSSGGVQSDKPTDPVFSDPQFYGWVKHYSSEENKWQPQLTQLSQQQTVPEAEGEEQKDNCEEEITTDMVFMA